MNARYEPDHELEDRLSRRLLDVFIRVGLVLALVLLCYLIFSPFLTMMLWALILAITIYPLHQMLAARIGGKTGAAAARSGPSNSLARGSTEANLLIGSRYLSVGLPVSSEAGT